jgi:hypothetical protein
MGRRTPGYGYDASNRPAVVPGQRPASSHNAGNLQDCGGLVMAQLSYALAAPCGAGRGTWDRITRKSRWKPGREALRQAKSGWPHWSLREHHAGSCAGLAQLVEHLICNQGVGGSNPSAGTKENQALSAN